MEPSLSLPTTPSSSKATGSLLRGSCRECALPLGKHGSRTGLCRPCWLKGRTEAAVERRPTCEDCGKKVGPRSTICRDCYASRRAATVSKCQECGVRLKVQGTLRCRSCHLKWMSGEGAARYAAARATAQGGHAVQRSKAEDQAKELLDLLGVETTRGVAIGRWIVDFLCTEKRLVVEVHGAYWHDRPSAVDRDQRKKAWLEAQGYAVLFLRTDRMHLWWQELLSSGFVEGLPSLSTT
jgi:very-short-patch-repair endonuclease